MDVSVNKVLSFITVSLGYFVRVYLRCLNGPSLVHCVKQIRKMSSVQPLPAYSSPTDLREILESDESCSYPEKGDKVVRFCNTSINDLSWYAMPHAVKAVLSDPVTSLVGQKSPGSSHLSYCKHISVKRTCHLLQSRPGECTHVFLLSFPEIGEFVKGIEPHEIWACCYQIHKPQREVYWTHIKTRKKKLCGQFFLFGRVKFSFTGFSFSHLNVYSVLKAVRNSTNQMLH